MTTWECPYCLREGEVRRFEHERDLIAHLWTHVRNVRLDAIAVEPTSIDDGRGERLVRLV